MAIKSIAYFPKSVAMNGTDILKDFVKGAQKQGLVPVENSMDADCAVIWSVLWNGRMASNQRVYEHYRYFGKPVIIIDIGALHRGITWKIAIDNINANGYYGHTVDLDNDRPRKLRLTLGQQVSNNGKILIATQHRRSEQSKTIDIENWVVRTFYKLREYTDRKIVIRPHPRCNINMDRLPSTVSVETPVKLSKTYDSYNLTYNWHTLINYNSGPGIQAAIAGCPIIVDQSSLAYPVSMELRDIELPYRINREQWLIEIAHTEYTQDEIRAGTWVKRLLENQ